MIRDSTTLAFLNRWYQKRNLAAEFLLVAFPKILNGVGLIIINAIALQVLGPAQFGVFYVCSVAILMTDGVLGSAFDMGVVRLVPTLIASEPRRAQNIETAALLLKSAIAVTAALCLVSFATPLAKAAFGLADAGILIYLSCSAAIALLAFRSVQVHLQVQQRFATYGAFDLLASLLRLGGVVLVLTLFLPEPAYLLAVLAIAPAVAFAVGIVTVGRPLLSVHPGIFPASNRTDEFRQMDAVHVLRNDGSGQNRHTVIDRLEHHERGWDFLGRTSLDDDPGTSRHVSGGCDGAKDHARGQGRKLSKDVSSLPNRRSSSRRSLAGFGVRESGDHTPLFLARRISSVCRHPSDSVAWRSIIHGEFPAGYLVADVFQAQLPRQV